VVGQYAYYGYYGAGGITLGVDFIQEMGSLVEVPNAGRLFWGIGAGGGMVMAGSASAIGVSGVFELGWHFESYPIELTSDWRPTYYLGNAFLSGLYSGYGGGAIRYFF
jgi:hypothetical protein